MGHTDGEKYKIRLSTIFSVGLSAQRKRLIAEVINFHVALEWLLDDLAKHGKIRLSSEDKTFSEKVCKVKRPDLRSALSKFNEARNKCAHKQLDTRLAVVAVLERCSSFIKRVEKMSPRNFQAIAGHGYSPLSAAVMVLFDELTSEYGGISDRPKELDGLYYPGEKTLDDRIIEVLGSAER